MSITPGEPHPFDIAGTKTYLSTVTGAGMSNSHRSGYISGIFPPARTVTASRK